jgi:cell division protease FtsH
LLTRKGVVINAQAPPRGSPWWQILLASFGPTLLLLLLLFLLFRRLGGAGGALSAFGQAHVRRYRPTTERVSFADIAGIDEAKEELSEIVDFLQDPERYRRLGARIPHGVLLSGPPGAGKTLLARAVAGEANAPFFSLSASEFVEMLVGVGASRVRDLFTQAKQSAPAIIFIDELDAIGRSRMTVTGFSGGHDEREQTLNQILAEMDGFDPSTGVIVLAATNRPDVLDAALLRPGRFDRRINVQPPDTRGRREILQVHARPVPLADDIDLQVLAQQTPGMVGADLANLVNEAALGAARHGHSQVTMDDFGAAFERIVLGAERKVMLDPDDRRRAAYHEAGHALVGMLTPDADPVRKVSIIPRGVALGVTFAAPSSDRFSYGEQYLRTKIRVGLGGRAADELVFGERTTGAEMDLQELTQLARQMVGRWGMSDRIGAMTVLPADGAAPPLPVTAESSDRMHDTLDDEVQQVLEQAHEEARGLLAENRDKLDALAEALLEHETLDEDEAYEAAGLEPPSGRGAVKGARAADADRRAPSRRGSSGA